MDEKTVEEVGNIRETWSIVYLVEHENNVQWHGKTSHIFSDTLSSSNFINISRNYLVNTCCSIRLSLLFAQLPWRQLGRMLPCVYKLLEMRPWLKVLTP